ncbi:U3 small nucleolar RNA-associated protein 18 homolog wicked [Tachypleus tridentatus]|uniref:U3 small nucleolar RNA-associated protein 18 homolog wicked n=1 Tax=Tachypleus tridentatus TaxID=6853 RepID=UPI003FD3C061
MLRYSLKRVGKVKSKKPVSGFSKRRKEVSDNKLVLGDDSESEDKEEKELEKNVLGGESDVLDHLSIIDQEFGPKLSRVSVDERLTEDDQPEKSCKTLYEEKQSAWNDEDDNLILVNKKSAIQENINKGVLPSKSQKYSEHLKQKYMKITSQPKWAQAKEKDKKSGSDDESDEDILQRTGNFLVKSQVLPSKTIQVQKCCNLNDEVRSQTVIKSVEFHPKAQVALVADFSGTATIFQVDGKYNSKIQSVHFDNFPIHEAHFSIDGEQLISSSRAFGHFFSYDMMNGKVVRIPCNEGMDHMNIKKFEMSPDGKYIVIYGRYGNIHLMTTRTKEWISSMKMNGEVCAVSFNRDGTKMYTHGDLGQVYVWDMNSRLCVHRFYDEGCVKGSSLAVSPNQQYLAAGSDTGVVNIYETSNLENCQNPKPTKTLFNLTTQVTNLKFNCTSELLAMSSFLKNNAVKLVHFPTMTVFSNFPLFHHNFNRVNSLDISLNSGYMCFGNNKGTAFLFRLKHYSNY